MSQPLLRSEVETVCAEIEEQADEVRRLRETGADAIKEKASKMLEEKTRQTDKETEELRLLAIKCPRGMPDYHPSAVVVRESVLEKIKETFKRHGGECVETPVLEQRDLLLGVYGEASEQRVYELQENGGQLLSMRYDLTVPFARYLINNKISAMKRYHIARVYRKVEPEAEGGDSAEFFQCDFDIAGTYDSMLPEAECVKIIDEVLTALNLGNYVIKINHRVMLEAVLVELGADASQFKSICSAVSKLDKQPWEQVKQKIIEECGLSQRAAAKLGTYVRFRDFHQDLDNVASLDAMLQMEVVAANDNFRRGVDEMKLLLTYCHAFGVSAAVRFEPFLWKEMDYYTGVIFEAVFPSSIDENGANLPLASVATGGRYDGLVSKLDPRVSVPCCGLSLSMEQFAARIEAKNSAKRKTVRTSTTQVFVASVQERLLPERMRLVAQLWSWGIAAEISYENDPRLRDQLQYAAARHIPFVLILTERDLKQGLVRLRYMENRLEQIVRVNELKTTLAQLLKRSSPVNDNDTWNNITAFLKNWIASFFCCV